MAVLVKDKARPTVEGIGIAAADGAVGTQRVFDDKFFITDADQVDPNISTMGRHYQPSYLIGTIPGEDDTGLYISDTIGVDYRENTFDPPLVLDLTNEYYRADGIGGLKFHEVCSLDSGTAISNGTMIDSAGNIVWRAHGLALNSDAPVTQNIVVEVGAEYTVEMTGVGDVTLSDAGVGVVTQGAPVSIIASTTTLTLTVDTVSTMWAYRSDLGGMARNPDTGTRYVKTGASQVFMRRQGNYINGENKGLLIETETRTNILLNSDVLSTQVAAVTAVPHTLHFTGDGTITLSGASTDGPLVGTGSGENNRVSLTFTPSAGALTLTVTGTVLNADLEIGSTVSSHKPTLNASLTRNGDKPITIPFANLPVDSGMPEFVSFASEGVMSFADRNQQDEVVIFDWAAGIDDYIRTAVNTDAASGTGAVEFSQKDGMIERAKLSAINTYTPGTNVPFSHASRHGSSFVNGAHEGTLL